MDESIGLLSFAEGDRSYYINNIDGETMNHLRNMCTQKRVKHITNRKGEAMIDLGVKDEEHLLELQNLIDNE